MGIVERLTGLHKEVTISRVDKNDLTTLTKKRYFFSWKVLASKADLYKLTRKGEKDILGVMALVDFPDDKRIEIKLLASSKENIGKNKTYENIAGCLIAYACWQALRKYSYMSCVSLLPKTELRQHYIRKYNMWDSGRHIFLEGPNLNDMIKNYLL